LGFSAWALDPDGEKGGAGAKLLGEGFIQTVGGGESCVIGSVSRAKDSSSDALPFGQGGGWFHHFCPESRLPEDAVTSVAWLLFRWLEEGEGESGDLLTSGDLLMKPLAEDREKKGSIWGGGTKKKGGRTK